MRTRLPVPLWRGTRPSQAANSRPDRKAAGSPIIATRAVAPSNPTPGIAATRWLAGLFRRHASSRCSITPTSSTSAATRPHCSRWVSTTIAGSCSESRGHVSLHPGPAARHHLAVLGQQNPQAVDLCRMESISDAFTPEESHILFAPHHGRKSGRVPKAWLNTIDPTIIIVGEAPSSDLNYYDGYDTITQNSAGDIVFECLTGKTHVYVSRSGYSVDFLRREDVANTHGYYIGTFDV